jgi:dihydroorotate dehydrogenase
MVYPHLRRLLFRLDPEASHGIGMAALRALGALGAIEGRSPRLPDGAADPRLAQRLLGLAFPNPLGLAAGFDKDAVAVRGFAALGFGFVEVGTVTPRPQAGNPRPRLFRLPEAASLQNALGFNNAGLDAMAGRLRALRRAPLPIPLGVNLGKNKDTPAERALDDYEALVRGVGALCDYLVVNLSSPNTPGLRDLQSEEFLRALLPRALALTTRPVLVKLSPDLPLEQAAALAGTAVDAGAAGILVTNTTTEYALAPGARDFGGLSGRVLKEKSFRMLQALAPLRKRAVLVSVGGIDSGEEAYRRLRAGASLLQVYTALVYEGPGLPRRILRELLALLERDGARSVAEVIGADAPG